MGKQRNIRLRLTIGDLSFYERLDEWLMRKKPEQVNRSPATIKVGGQFGKASTMGRLLRGSLLPLIAVTNTNAWSGAWWQHCTSGACTMRRNRS